MTKNEYEKLLEETFFKKITASEESRVEVDEDEDFYEVVVKNPTKIDLNEIEGY